MALKELTRFEGTRLVVELDHVHEHLAAARRVRQHDECVRVRDEPALAAGAVRTVRREVVEARERLHALHEADPARHPPGELPDMGALAADDAAVVAVEEADELEALLVRLLDDLVGCHGSASTDEPGWMGAADDRAGRARSDALAATGPAPFPERPRRRA